MRWGIPQANSTTSRPSLDLTGCVRDRLAVLGGEEAGDVVPMLHQQFPVGEQDALANRQRGVAPTGKGGLRRSNRGIHIRSTEPRARLAVTSPVAGL